eukprot:Skav210084  [mRNA]  locus=scaffold1510:122587:123768:+ [translate_table: standard]
MTLKTAFVAPGGMDPWPSKLHGPRSLAQLQLVLLISFSCAMVSLLRGVFLAGAALLVSSECQVGLGGSETLCSSMSQSQCEGTNGLCTWNAVLAIKPAKPFFASTGCKYIPPEDYYYSLEEYNSRNADERDACALLETKEICSGSGGSVGLYGCSWFDVDLSCESGRVHPISRSLVHKLHLIIPNVSCLPWKRTIWTRPNGMWTSILHLKTSVGTGGGYYQRTLGCTNRYVCEAAGGLWCATCTDEDIAHVWRKIDYIDDLLPKLTLPKGKCLDECAKATKAGGVAVGKMFFEQLLGMKSKPSVSTMCVHHG